MRMRHAYNVFACLKRGDCLLYDLPGTFSCHFSRLPDTVIDSYLAIPRQHLMPYPLKRRREGKRAAVPYVPRFLTNSLRHLGTGPSLSRAVIEFGKAVINNVFPKAGKLRRILRPLKRRYTWKAAEAPVPGPAKNSRILLPASFACIQPVCVSGISVRPVYCPVSLHIVCPCRSRISLPCNTPCAISSHLMLHCRVLSHSHNRYSYNRYMPTQPAILCPSIVIYHCYQRLSAVGPLPCGSTHAQPLLPARGCRFHPLHTPSLYHAYFEFSWRRAIMLI